MCNCLTYNIGCSLKWDPVGVLPIRVPCKIGDLKAGPNLENYPYRSAVYLLGVSVLRGSTKGSLWAILGSIQV